MANKRDWKKLITISLVASTVIMACYGVYLAVYLKQQEQEQIYGK